MDRTDIGLWGLAASGILVAVALGVSLWRRLGVERTLVWACLRALVQLLLVGWALQLIVDDRVPSRGHRTNIFKKEFKVVGVNIGSHKRYGSLCVMDYAGGFSD